MRVIAGKAKGHRLKSPVMGTRPMTDRMKESLFSSLGDLTGLKILDLYAGSGSLGLEALSRGAKQATFVENARDAISKLEENISATGFGRKSEVVWSDVGHMLARQADKRVDLIFLDPPYSAPASSVSADLESLVTGGFLSDEGRIVVHRPGKESKLKPLGLKMVWEKEYGQSRLYLFAHEEEEPG
ncbi:MAG: 16S rRNA (guanine(966)-N(2))-methyltransferase RsmD [Actinomycetota bacterium]